MAMCVSIYTRMNKRVYMYTYVYVYICIRNHVEKRPRMAIWKYMHINISSLKRDPIRRVREERHGLRHCNQCAVDAVCMLPWR